MTFFDFMTWNVNQNNEVKIEGKKEKKLVWTLKWNDNYTLSETLTSVSGSILFNLILHFYVIIYHKWLYAYRRHHFLNKLSSDLSQTRENKSLKSYLMFKQPVKFDISIFFVFDKWHYFQENDVTFTARSWCAVTYLALSDHGF